MLIIKRRGRAIIFCYKYILLYMYLCKINNLKFLFGLILPLSVRDYQNLVIKIHEHEKCICWNFTIIFSIFNWLISDAFERFNCNIFVNDHHLQLSCSFDCVIECCLSYLQEVGIDITDLNTVIVRDNKQR